MRSGNVGDKQLQVSEICVNNIGLLMKRSRVEPDDVLPITETKKPQQTPIDTDPDPLPLDTNEVAVKAAIANAIAEQYRRAGRTIMGDELSKMVDRFVT